MGNVSLAHNILKNKRFDIVISRTALGAYTFSGVEDLKHVHDMLNVGGKAIVEIQITPEDVYFMRYPPSVNTMHDFVEQLNNQCYIETKGICGFNQILFEITRTDNKPLRPCSG